ncbi:MAG: L,D-transpeptidase scaffold domain-containing protein, partial [Lutibacter sp.]
MLLILTSCKEKVSPKVSPIPKIEITEAGKIIPIDSSKKGRIKDSSVIAFYSTNKNYTFWMLDAHRENIKALFNNLEQDGLFPKDFDLKKIQHSEENLTNLSNSELVDYDILLTEN